MKAVDESKPRADAEGCAGAYDRLVDGIHVGWAVIDGVRANGTEPTETDRLALTVVMT